MMFIGGYLKAAKFGLIALVALAAIGAYGYHKVVAADRDNAYAQLLVAEGQISVAEARADDAMLAVGEWQGALARVQEQMEEMAEVQREASRETRRLTNVFGNHNIEVLALGRPGTIQRLINSGTADIFCMLKSATGDNECNQ